MKTVKTILPTLIVILVILLVGCILGIGCVLMGCLLPILLVLAVMIPPVAEGLVLGYTFILTALVKLDEIDLFARYRKKSGDDN